MSQENVEIVRRCIESLNPRDLSQLFELFDADIEIDLSRNVFNPEIYRGHSGLERLRSVNEDVWRDFRAAPEEIIDAGDNKVVTAITMYGKGKGSGVDVTMQVFQVWMLRDSRIVRVVGGYRDRAEALEAAGMSE